MLLSKVMLSLEIGRKIMFTMIRELFTTRKTAILKKENDVLEKYFNAIRQAKPGKKAAAGIIDLGLDIGKNQSEIEADVLAIQEYKTASDMYDNLAETFLPVEKKSFIAGEYFSDTNRAARHELERAHQSASIDYRNYIKELVRRKLALEKMQTANPWLGRKKWIEFKTFERTK